MINLGVLISGSGTNMCAIQEAILAKKLDAKITLVVASRPQAKGLVRAQEYGLPTLSMSKELYENPIVADEVIATELELAGVDYVVMAGYMRKVYAPILQTFPNRVLNIHPALLPSFTGAHAIEDAYKKGVKVTGVTVHFANEIYDAGPIIAQSPVVISEGMTLEELEAKIHGVEHVLYPQVLQKLSENKVEITDSGVVKVYD